MFRSGRRWFTCGAISLILIAILHGLGHFATPEHDAKEMAVISAMQDHKMEMGLGMNPSLWDAFQGLSLTMCVTMLALGLQSLAVAHGDESGRLVRQYSVLNVVTLGGLVAVYLFHQLSVPLVAISVAEILFV